MINSNVGRISGQFSVTILHYDASRSSKVIDLYVIWKPVCDFLLVINNNISPILHRSATVHAWQTDNRRQPWQQCDCYL